jgi:hypothetical protein
MNFADIFSVIVYLVMTVSLGAVFLSAVSAPKLLRNGAAFYLAGQLLWLLLFLLSMWLHLSVIPVIWGIGSVAVGGGGIMVWRSRNSFCRVVLALAVVSVICALCFPQVIYMVLREPLIEWDARSIWFFHAKGIWVHGGIAAEFFANRRYGWSHADYPLLLPVQAAVIGVLRGEWSEMAVKGFLFLNFAAYFWLLQRVLVERGWGRISAWAFAVPVMGIAFKSYVNGYADNHYAMPLMLAALLAFQSRKDAGEFALAGLFAAYALNVKNESALYVFAGLILWAFFRYIKGGLLSLRLGGSTCGWGVLLLGLMPFMLWAMFKISHGIKGDMQLLSRLLHPVDSVAICVERAPHIFNAMGIAYCVNRAHILLAVVLLLNVLHAVSVRQVKSGSVRMICFEERVFGALLLTVNFMIFAVYAMTPYDVDWHLETSVSRLIVLPVLMLIPLLIIAVEKLMGIYCLEAPAADRYSL